MLNTFHDITKEASLKKRLLPCIVFLIMGSVIFYFSNQNGFTPSKITAVSVFACGAVFLLLPFIGKKLYYLISLAAAAINYVLLNTLLVLFYYLLFTPLALIIRVFVKHAISRKMDLKKRSMWEEHRTVLDLKQYFKQF